LHATAWFAVFVTAVLVLFGITELLLGIRRLFKRQAGSDIGFLDKPISAIALNRKQGGEAQDLAQLAAAIAVALDDDRTHKRLRAFLIARWSQRAPTG